MANEQTVPSDELKKSPNVEQPRKEGQTNPKDRERSEKVKKDEAIDDRFRATDN